MQWILSFLFATATFGSVAADSPTTAPSTRGVPAGVELAQHPCPTAVQVVVRAAEINDVNHIADPNQFGVDAWRHYLGRRDRAAWLREIIAGNVVPEFPKEGP